MNCGDFENLVNDLARARVMNAQARARGIAHAEACDRCAARLADELALTAGLKALAASDHERAASENLEAALLEAFRARSANPISRHSVAKSGPWPRWALAAAAAAILIAFGLIVYRLAQVKSGKDDLGIETATPATRPSVKREEQLPQIEPAKVEQQVVERKPLRELRARQRIPRRASNRLQTDRLFIRDSITAYVNDGENATDFFTLDFGADQTPMESGEVIRVQMPRSALVRFGLPVNVEHADVPVKADLLVGEDGLARAIRIVR